MANLKQRLRRKNSSGDYDTIYLQSDLSNVTGTLGVSNGGTGATSASAALSALGGAASSHNHAATAITYGSSSNVSAEIDDLKTSVSNGKSLIASAITDKGVSTSSTATFQVMASNISLIPSMPTPPAWVQACNDQEVGTVINHSGYDWIIVHKTLVTAVLGLRYWYTSTVFGSNTTYKGSTLANLAATFENGLTTETKLWLNNVTVNNVTAKVFIPSYEQVGTVSGGAGSFSYYNGNTNRKFTDSGGTAKYWWTSTAYGSSSAYGVNTDGGLNAYAAGPSQSYGFRPHMEVMVAVPI